MSKPKSPDPPNERFNGWRHDAPYLSANIEYRDVWAEVECEGQVINIHTTDVLTIDEARKLRDWLNEVLP